jgi:hypothetical protein
MDGLEEGAIVGIKGMQVSHGGTGLHSHEAGRPIRAPGIEPTKDGTLMYPGN